MCEGARHQFKLESISLVVEDVDKLIMTGNNMHNIAMQTKIADTTIEVVFDIVDSSAQTPVDAGTEIRTRKKLGTHKKHCLAWTQTVEIIPSSAFKKRWDMLLRIIWKNRGTHREAIKNQKWECPFERAGFAVKTVFTQVRQNPGCQNKDNKQKWAEMIEVPTETGYKWENDLFLKQVKLSTKDNCKKMDTIKNMQISDRLNRSRIRYKTINVWAGILRSNNDITWVCHVKSADKWNTGLADGRSNPPLHKWLVKATRCLEAAPAAQRWKQWHNARGQHEASLAWVLNDMFGNVFWIGGTFKRVPRIYIHEYEYSPKP
ncbi:hypothetical protein DFH08DRAFT_801208 [Mycena albidolilacea]|uniref:Uncharacterized protein n=1 Tax=Mycena albidolilacea TaxID=1033008 RepID=A0AAD7AJ25_9AGAR|nr:hypothetical protein DFH08DRAFT_801208 [Mycena albidolilacea]